MLNAEDLNKIVSVQDLGDRVSLLAQVKVPHSPVIEAAKQSFIHACKNSSLSQEIEFYCRELNKDCSRGLYVGINGEKYISGHTVGVLTQAFLNTSQEIDEDTKSRIDNVAKHALSLTPGIGHYASQIKPL